MADYHSTDTEFNDMPIAGCNYRNGWGINPDEEWQYDVPRSGMFYWHTKYGNISTVTISAHLGSQQ